MLPDQVRSTLHTSEQYRTCAQRHSIPPNFNQTFLVNADPVGKQAEVHVMDDCLSMEVVPAAIRDVGTSGVRFLLYAPAEQSSGGKLRAVSTHDSYEHVYPSRL
jgi:hypothetical protein